MSETITFETDIAQWKISKKDNLLFFECYDKIVGKFYKCNYSYNDRIFRIMKDYSKDSSTVPLGVSVIFFCSCESKVIRITISIPYSSDEIFEIKLDEVKQISDKDLIIQLQNRIKQLEAGLNKSPIDLNEIYTTLLKKNGKLLRFISDPSSDLCKIAVTQTYKAFKHVPLQTKELFYIAHAQNNKDTIANVQNCDEELLLDLVKNHDCKYIYKHIKIITHDLALELLNFNYEFMNVLSDILTDQDMIDFFNSYDNWDKLCPFIQNIREFPEEFLNKVISKISLGYLTCPIREKISLEQWKIAIENNPSNIQYLTFESNELINLALSRDGMALRHIPQHQLQYKYLKIAIENNIKSFKTVLIGNMMICFAQSTFNYHPDLIYHVIVRKPKYIKYFQYLNEIKPLEYKKACSIALKSSSRNLKYIEHQDDEMCMNAIENNSNNLKYVKNQTLELCLKAVKVNIENIIYVKKEFIEVVLKSL
jgi:hypothetical protein